MRKRRAEGLKFCFDYVGRGAFSSGTPPHQQLGALPEGDARRRPQGDYRRVRLRAFSRDFGELHGRRPF